VRIRSAFAAFKHGTIFHLFSGESPFANSRFDSGQRMFVPNEDSSAGGLVGGFVGHMVVGTVSEVGPDVSAIAVGDTVFCYAPCCETVVKAAKDVHALVEPLTELEAVCIDPAYIGYAAVRDAKATLGDRVVVFGLGAIGLSIVQLLRRAGCLATIAVDPLTKRRRLAERFGADLTLDPSACDVGAEVRRYLGQGADIAIEASGSYRALAGALRAVTNCARIVTLGYYRGQGSELVLAAEWHHNRLEMISSMPEWGNPSREHPLWTQQRLWETTAEFYRRGWLTAEGLVEPVVPFADAAQAFMDVYRDPSQAIKLGVRFA
jgi:threonine dehydrogenase-like Zn-dependent dehydrogenase